MRPNYFIFIEHLRKRNESSKCEPNTPLNLWTPFPEIPIPSLTLVHQCTKYEHSQANLKHGRSICFTGHTTRTGFVNPFQLNEISLYYELDQSLSVLRMLGGIFHLYSNFDRNFCKQPVETLIRRRVLLRLIWGCTVCLRHIKKDTRLI